MSRGHPAVGTITITPDGPGKVRSQQGLRSGLVTVGVDPKYALRRTDRHPQPLQRHTLTMARLIDIDDARLAHRPLGAFWGRFFYDSPQNEGDKTLLSRTW